MIIFFGDGRLGNQIFQYAFIKNFVKKNELIVTCNFHQVLELFDIKERILNIKNRYIAYFCRKFLKYFLKPLSFTRIISSVSILKENVSDFNVSSNHYKYIRGLLPITYIYPGYFQSESFFNEDKVREMVVRSKHSKKAKDYIKTIQSRHKIFVHIRRGDYQDFIVLGNKDTLLPKKYYEKQIQIFVNKYSDCFFIFLSDDIDYVKDNFNWVKNKVISNNDMYTDFALMTLCDGGIMSNSSFSWWGGYMIKEKDLIAPKYWLGFKKEIEYPRGIGPNFAKLVSI